MKKLTITNGFAKMSDSNLVTKAQKVYTAMFENENFTSPEPSLQVLKALLAAFEEAIYDARDADRLKLAIKNQRRVELITGLHMLADYVLFKSNGNSVVALSSGFTISKEPSPTPPITKPQNLRVMQGVNPAELLSKINRVKGGVSYLHQYATDDMLAKDMWQSVPSSKTTCIIANLTPGTKYNCRVAVLGVKDQLLYSDIVTRIVA